MKLLLCLPVIAFCEITDAKAGRGILFLEDIKGLTYVPVRKIDQSQVVEAGCNIWVVRAKGLLVDRQGALVERLGLGKVAKEIVEPGQVVEAGCNARVVRAKGLLIDRQGAL